MSAYDPSNIFAKILKGDLPSEKVYEDERTYAFMDIMPRSDGHVLIIPKAPSRNIFDMDPDDVVAVARTVQLLAIATKKAFNADGVTVHQANERAGGQVVFHTHFHVMPRKEGVPLRLEAQEMAKPETLAANAALIRAALADA